MVVERLIWVHLFIMTSSEHKENNKDASPISKLDKFLEKISDKVIQSNSTESRYYHIGEVKIRISGHYTIKKFSGFQIISTEEENKFVVIHSPNKKVSIMSYDEVRDFLKSISKHPHLYETYIPTGEGLLTIEDWLTYGNVSATDIKKLLGISNFRFSEKQYEGLNENINKLMQMVRNYVKINVDNKNQ